MDITVPLHKESDRSQKEDRVSLLKSVWLLHDLPESTTQHFADKSVAKRHEKGRLLFMQGEEAEWFYLIVRGRVKLFHETIEGTEAVIDVRSDGDIFGELCIFDQQRYSHSAEIIETTEYLMIPISLLQYYMDKHKQIAMNMLMKMSRQQQVQSREIEHLNVQNAPQRIGCFLLRLCPDDNLSAPVQLNLPYDKTLIAARLGMKPETFSRALLKLRQDIGIEVSGSIIHIPSTASLTEYTCNHCSQSIKCKE